MCWKTVKNVKKCKKGIIKCVNKCKKVYKHYNQILTSIKKLNKMLINVKKCKEV